jgi:hypothetical protein
MFDANRRRHVKQPLAAGVEINPAPAYSAHLDRQTVVLTVTYWQRQHLDHKVPAATPLNKPAAETAAPTLCPNDLCQHTTPTLAVVIGRALQQIAEFVATYDRQYRLPARMVVGVLVSATVAAP